MYEHHSRRAARRHDLALLLAGIAAGTAPQALPGNQPRASVDAVFEPLPRPPVVRAAARTPA